MHTHLGLSSLSFCHFLFLSAVSASSPKMHLRTELKYCATVMLMALIFALTYVALDDAPEATSGISELSSYLNWHGDAEPEDFYKFRDDFQWLSANGSNTTSGLNVTVNGTNETVSGNFSCDSCTYSYSGGGSAAYDGVNTCANCMVYIAGDFSFYGNGGGELIYALSSLFITANAYYDIQVTFQTVSMQISNGGLAELLYGSVWMDGDIQLNSGKVPPPVPFPNTPFSGPFYGQATSPECEFGIIRLDATEAPKFTCVVQLLLALFRVSLQSSHC